MASSSIHTILLSIAPMLAAGSFVLVLLALFFIIMTNRRIEKLTLGKNGTVEETVGVLTAHMKEMQTFRGELELYLKHAESRLRTSIRGVGVVRFNPFSNDGSSGGNQSFAIAFLDEKHSGVVFSALYARDRVGVYAKPIEGGTSSFTLSDEETEAVEKAKGSVGAKQTSAK